MIPRELNLDARQTAKYARWEKWLKKTISDDFALKLLDEDCVVTSPISFELYCTGLGTVIYATCPVAEGKRSKINLSIDDDNELTPDEWLT